MNNIIDCTISRSDLQIMNEDELCDLFMYADRDRKDIGVAEKIYWWCIDEINKRIEVEEKQRIGN